MLMRKKLNFKIGMRNKITHYVSKNHFNSAADKADDPRYRNFINQLEV